MDPSPSGMHLISLRRRLISRWAKCCSTIREDSSIIIKGGDKNQNKPLEILRFISILPKTIQKGEIRK
jgi:hypothetical protein